MTLEKELEVCRQPTEIETEMIAVASEMKKDGAFIGASDRDGGREIGYRVLGEGESTTGCGDGVGEGCGGDDED
ncbi:hypothetical protein Pyn_13986 [Prunus yedoensis var. nudiflora]|uniref:Uncharacterized protein n=1 Tax=Prunus yedoensis var. nudiflora TaxID=2094558 RepID=A0A314Z5F8_PRUYE|nr:hypothetical protein Pyn_13986 [Prunus yedoensis var. nudiflora]